MRLCCVTYIKCGTWYLRMDYFSCFKVSQGWTKVAAAMLFPVNISASKLISFWGWFHNAYITGLGFGHRKLCNPSVNFFEHICNSSENGICSWVHHAFHIFIFWYWESFLLQVWLSIGAGFYSVMIWKTQNLLFHEEIL